MTAFLAPEMGQIFCSAYTIGTSSSQKEPHRQYQSQSAPYQTRKVECHEQAQIICIMIITPLVASQINNSRISISSY